MTDRTCGVDGCDNPIPTGDNSTAHARVGVRHYTWTQAAPATQQRPGAWTPLLRSDDMSDPTPRRNCLAPGCVKDTRKGVRGYCPMHWSRIIRTGTVDAQPPRPTAEERLRNEVTVTASGCIEWNGPKNNRGYGRIGRDYAHRLAYELHHGPIPAGMFVLHSCDNPSCCNPQHLRVGTHRDNMRDAVERDRVHRPGPAQVRGEANATAKLTEADVLAIRDDAQRGVTQRFLAARYGVTQGCISSITTRRTWRHV